MRLVLGFRILDFVKIDVLDFLKASDRTRFSLVVHQLQHYQRNSTKPIDTTGFSLVEFQLSAGEPVNLYRARVSPGVWLCS